MSQEGESSDLADDGAVAGPVDEEPTGAREPTVVVGEAEDDPDDGEPGILDPSYEELWEGTDAMRLDLPEIPALDLDWGNAEGEDHPFA
jgi:hypothetical protein